MRWSTLCRVRDSNTAKMAGLVFGFGLLSFLLALSSLLATARHTNPVLAEQDAIRAPQGVSDRPFGSFVAPNNQNPPTQTISIQNIGGQALDWIANTDTVWLNITPTSGTAPSTLQVSADGTGLPVGTYTGVITITGTSPNTQNAVQTVLVTLDVKRCTLAYEFDCDCDVDVVDLMQVPNRWHCRSGEGCYKECYDIDQDGDVDIVDIMRVSAHWGEVCLPNLSPSTKSVDRTTAKPGDVLTYTITINNTGACDTLGAVLTDTIPAHVTLVPGSIKVTGGAGLSATSARARLGAGIKIILTWQGNVPKGNSVTLTFRVTVNNDVPNGTVITNVAQINDRKGNIVSRSATTTIAR